VVEREVHTTLQDFEPGSMNRSSTQLVKTERKMGQILIIDDHPEMRAMLEQTLRVAGHEVFLAADGGQGLELCRAKPVNLVITDLYMPGKEGVETIMELHRDFPEIAIIAMSGKPGAESLRGATKKLGATQTLEKPFQPDELLAAVEEVLRDRKP
jgi:DNA-binding response OmpR family regulator